MSKVPMINTLLLMSRRSHSVAVENATVQTEVTVLTKAVESGSVVAAEQSGSAVAAEQSGSAVAAEQRKEIFWMRDPKSGNWIPETHFDEIDVAELRKKLLPQKKKP